MVLLFAMGMIGSREWFAIIAQNQNAFSMACETSYLTARRLVLEHVLREASAFLINKADAALQFIAFIHNCECTYGVLPIRFV